MGTSLPGIGMMVQGGILCCLPHCCSSPTRCSSHSACPAAGRSKPLSAAEEREYLRRYAQGDQEARDVLIERNLRLVAHIIKKYYTQSADQEDLISIGTIGLIKGISSFDPEKGARLATYAARCIENEILMYFRSQKSSRGEVSLSDSIETDKEGNALQLMDVVGVDDTMLDDIHDRDSALRLHQIIRERLTTREAEIIRLRYGLGGTIP